MQQEKQKLTQDINKKKDIFVNQNQATFQTYTQKYDTVMKEKMIMKLEKERLVAKVENLEKSLLQLEEGTEDKDKTELKSKLLETQESSKPQLRKEKPKIQAGTPTPYPASDPANPYAGDDKEPMNPQLQLVKTFKGHLMGCTGLCYN